MKASRAACAPQKISGSGYTLRVRKNKTARTSAYRKHVLASAAAVYTQNLVMRAASGTKDNIATARRRRYSATAATPHLQCGRH